MARLLPRLMVSFGIVIMPEPLGFRGSWSYFLPRVRESLLVTDGRGWFSGSSARDASSESPREGHESRSAAVGVLAGNRLRRCQFAEAAPNAAYYANLIASCKRDG